MAMPKRLNDPLYQLLREGRVKEFNRRRRAGESCDLRDSDLRGVILQGLDAEGLDLSGCYLRQCDLRGVDLSHTRMEGSSINGARISGAFFPKQLSSEEITLSLLHGTRMRYRE
jgi:uncharacterized protein YjbI with pentapeptide repeats